MYYKYYVIHKEKDGRKQRYERELYKIYVKSSQLKTGVFQLLNDLDDAIQYIIATKNIKICVSYTYIFS